MKVRLRCALSFKTIWEKDGEEEKKKEGEREGKEEMEREWKEKETRMVTKAKPLENLINPWFSD